MSSWAYHFVASIYTVVEPLRRRRTSSNTSVARVCYELVALFKQNNKHLTLFVLIYDPAK